MDLEAISERIKENINIKKSYDSLDIQISTDTIKILLTKKVNFRGQKLLIEPCICLIPNSKIDYRRFLQVGIDYNSIENELRELSIEVA